MVRRTNVFHVFALIAALFISGQIYKSETVQAEETARLAAVLVYADWCGSCKVLDPKVKEAQAAELGDGISFITLDYTARDADAFFAAADNAGVGEAVRAELGDTVKTGVLLLVDVDDKRVVGKVLKTMSVEEIVAALTSAADAA